MEHLLEKKKYPVSNRRHIGIEIECLISNPDIRNVKKELVDKKLQWNVNFGYDGSVRDTEFVPRTEIRRGMFGDYPVPVTVNMDEQRQGVEIRILAEETEAPRIITEVCEILKRNNAKVNQTCGLHVHLDMRSRDAELVYKNLFKFQTPMFDTQPKHRKVGNKYCKRLYRPLTDKSESRYYSINRAAIKQHCTVEVRLHEGCIDASQIKMWCFLLMKIANIKDQIKRVQKDFSMLELPQPVKDYFNERIAKNVTGSKATA